MNYYNENDLGAAAWLQNLVDAALIPAGKVDARSIEEVTPDDLKGFTQCHFFAGIGGWPVALALAGWPTSKPIWTGSCPCQPFSGAGRQRGASDPRHLWPAWFALIAKCRPASILGEQVDKELGRAWLTAVRADLETLGYAWGGADLCAAGVGAPNIRQRHYWVAHTAGVDFGARLRDCEPPQQWGDQLANGGGNGYGLGYTQYTGLERHAGDGDNTGGWAQQARSVGPTSFWGECGWVYARDDKIRPVEPGTFPVADGLPGWMVEALCKGYGNAINPHQAAAFIRSVM